MKRKTGVISLLLLLCIISVPIVHAEPITIWDTGAGTNYVYTPYVNSTQWLSGQFTVTQNNITVNEISGYFWAEGYTPGTFTIALYNDTGFLDTNQSPTAIYSAEANVNSTAADWYGLNSLGWTLNVGTYWVAFEVRDGQTLDANMPDQVPNPLGVYAYGYNGYYFEGFSGYNAFNIGIQIKGDDGSTGPGPSPVPEPTTMLLVGIGLMGVAGMRRKFKR